MELDEGCIGLIGIIIGIVILIAIVVYVILPITVAVLVGVAGVGTISGTGVAVKNFSEVFVEAHKTIR